MSLTTVAGTEGAIYRQRRHGVHQVPADWACGSRTDTDCPEQWKLRAFLVDDPDEFARALASRNIALLVTSWEPGSAVFVAGDENAHRLVDGVLDAWRDSPSESAVGTQR